MGNFIKGMLVGTISFVVGLAVLTLVFPVPPQDPPHVTPRDAAEPVAGDAAMSAGRDVDGDAPADAVDGDAPEAGTADAVTGADESEALGVDEAPSGSVATEAAGTPAVDGVITSEAGAGIAPQPAPETAVEATAEPRRDVAGADEGTVPVADDASMDGGDTVGTPDLPDRDLPDRDLPTHDAPPVLQPAPTEASEPSAQEPSAEVDAISEDDGAENQVQALTGAGVAAPESGDPALTPEDAARADLEATPSADTDAAGATTAPDAPAQPDPALQPDQTAREGQGDDSRAEPVRANQLPEVAENGAEGAITDEEAPPEDASVSAPEISGETQTEPGGAAIGEADQPSDIVDTSEGAAATDTADGAVPAVPEAVEAAAPQDLSGETQDAVTPPVQSAPVRPTPVQPTPVRPAPASPALPQSASPTVADTTLDADPLTGVDAAPDPQAPGVEDLAPQPDSPPLIDTPVIDTPVIDSPAQSNTSPDDESTSADVDTPSGEGAALLPDTPPAEDVAPQANTSPEAQTPPTTGPAPQVEATPEAEAQIVPRVRTMPSGAPNIAVRRGGGATTASGVRVGRLPSIGARSLSDEADAADAAERATDADASDDAAATDADSAMLPAYRRNAATVMLEAESRALGVVLIESSIAETALLDLPFKVTLAMDPFDTDAPRRAAAYRAAGHEVALLASGIPLGATPTDLEVTVQAWMRDFPQVVALMDVPFDGISTRRTLARDMAQMLAPEGYGVIALRGTLDAFRQAAQNAGLASASVYRTLDDASQSGVTIRRMIDRAAFEAQRSDGILIVGSAANADTLTALTDFAQTGVRGVMPTPASAILAIE